MTETIGQLKEEIGELKTQLQKETQQNQEMKVINTKFVTNITRTINVSNMHFVSKNFTYT